MKTIQFPKLGLEFEINSIAFEIGSLRVAWYGIIIAVGFLLAIIYVSKNAKRFTHYPDKIIDVIFYSVIGGIIGARFYYVIFSLDEYKDNWLDAFKIWEGGIAIYGGLIGATLTAIIVGKIMKVKMLPSFDCAVIGVILAQGIGRWGNFINVEAFGGNTESIFGMTSPSITAYLNRHATELSGYGMTIDPTAPVHPCFLYESVWCILGFVALHFISKKRKFDGEVTLWYLIWYGVGRFVIEGLRTDSLMLGQLRVSQLLSAILIVACVIILVYFRTKIKRTNDPDYLPLYITTEVEIEKKEEKDTTVKEIEENDNVDTKNSGAVDEFFTDDASDCDDD